MQNILNCYFCSDSKKPQFSKRKFKNNFSFVVYIEIKEIPPCEKNHFRDAHIPNRWRVQNE